jgi:chromosome segregation ATPase
MGNPDGDNNATCAGTGAQTSLQLEGVDPEIFAEMLRIAKANVDERKRVAKEARDAAVAKCEAIIADLDPKIATLDAKIDQTAEQVKTATRERDEAERTADQIDVEFAEVSHVYEKVIPLKTRYEPLSQKVERLNREISALTEFNEVIKECAADRFEMDSRIHAAGSGNTAIHDQIRNEYISSRRRFYAAKDKCDKALASARIFDYSLFSFENCRADMISWHLNSRTNSRDFDLPEFERLRPQYLAVCVKIPPAEHEEINNRYISVNSKRENVYTVYKDTRTKLVQLEHKLEIQRNKIDELKRQRKEAAAELETLNSTN